ncbi:MAG TPA: hypothetical protein VF144_20785 [Chitinophagaceae bacterium]
MGSFTGLINATRFYIMMIVFSFVVYIAYSFEKKIVENYKKRKEDIMYSKAMVNRRQPKNYGTAIMEVSGLLKPAEEPLGPLNCMVFPYGETGKIRLLWIFTGCELSSAIFDFVADYQ